MVAMTPLRVIFYQTSAGRSPVEEFLDGLTDRQRAKALDALDILEGAGYRLGPPWLKKVEANLWELRVQAHKAWLRLFFCQDGARFVILHGLKKKTDKLPQRDLETARQRRRDHLGR